MNTLKILKWAAIGAYALSLFLPGLVYEGRGETVVMYGYSILLPSLLGGLAGIYAGYGNVLFIGSLLFARIRNLKTATVLAGVGFLVGLQAFQVRTFPLDEGSVVHAEVQYLGIGYYVWLLSFILFAGYAFMASRDPQITTAPPAKISSPF